MDPSSKRAKRNPKRFVVDDTAFDVLQRAAQPSIEFGIPYDGGRARGGCAIEVTGSLPWLLSEALGNMIARALVSSAAIGQNEEDRRGDSNVEIHVYDFERALDELVRRVVLLVASMFRSANHQSEEGLDELLQSVAFTRCDSLLQLLCSLTALRNRVSVCKPQPRVLFLDGLSNATWWQKQLSHTRQKGASRPDGRCTDLLPLAMRIITELVRKYNFVLVMTRVNLFGNKKGIDDGSNFLGASYSTLVTTRVHLEQHTNHVFGTTDATVFSSITSSNGDDQLAKLFQITPNGMEWFRN